MKNLKSAPAIGLLLLATGLALPACGNHLIPDSEAPLTPAQADENIADRLSQSSRVRKQVTELRDAFRKIEAVLHDFGYAMNRVFGHPPGDSLVELADQLPEIFGALSRSMVKTQQMDGTWSIEAPIVAGFRAGEIAQCLHPRARLTGKRVVDQEDLVLYLSDCDGANWDRLAKWIVRPDGAVEMSYWPLVRTNLRPVADPSGAVALPQRSGQCRFHFAGGKKQVSLTCGQEISWGEWALESLTLRDVEGGTAASLSVKVKEKYRAQAEFAPGHSPQFIYCEEGSGKCVSL